MKPEIHVILSVHHFWLLDFQGVNPTKPPCHPGSEVDELDPTLVALRERWEHLMQQEVQHLTTEEAWDRGMLLPQLAEKALKGLENENFVVV